MSLQSLTLFLVNSAFSWRLTFPESPGKCPAGKFDVLLKITTATIAPSFIEHLLFHACFCTLYAFIISFNSQQPHALGEEVQMEKLRYKAMKSLAWGPIYIYMVCGNSGNIRVQIWVDTMDTNHLGTFSMLFFIIFIPFTYSFSSLFSFCYFDLPVSTSGFFFCFSPNFCFFS